MIYLDRTALKAKAKEQISGNIGILFGAAAIIFAITSAVGIVSPIFSFSLVMIFLNLTKGEKPKVTDVFNGFNYFLKAFGLYFMMGLFAVLWTLLFIIPGIVKSLSYSMAPYIMAENPDIGIFDAIKQSRTMMHGHKWEYFVLGLSFILWHLLGVVTIGIAYIYVYPYICATNANFYNSIKGTANEATEADGDVAKEIGLEF